jgi:hypothetical protein
MKNYSRGFVPLLILVVVVSLGVVGLLGFYIEQRRENTSDSEQVQESSQTKKSTSIFESQINAEKKGRDAAIKSTLSGFRAQAELTYDQVKSYASICSNGVIGNSESYYTKTADFITEQLKATSQASAGIECVSSKDAYAVSSPLVYEDGTFCVDSRGYALKGSIDTKTMTCVTAQTQLDIPQI